MKNDACGVKISAELFVFLPANFQTIHYETDSHAAGSIRRPLELPIEAEWLHD